MGGYILQKRINSLQESFIHPPPGAVWGTLIWMDALLDYSWTVEQKHRPCYYKAWKSKDDF